MKYFYAFVARSWSGLAIAAIVAGLGGLVAHVAMVKAIAWAAFAACALYGLGVLLAVGGVVAIVRHAVARAKYPPKGKRVDVGGYRMHLLAEGTAADRPTVVWIPGGHSQGLHLYNFHKRIRGEARSILFDRPGTGWSDIGPFPRSTAREAEELATLLENAGERGPFVVVGHSYGGLLAANYARRHPDRTAAVILLDATPPDSFVYSPTGGNAATGLVRLSQLNGLMRMFGISLDPYTRMAARDPALARLLATIKAELADVEADCQALDAGQANAWASASVFGEFSTGRRSRAVPELIVYDGQLGDLPVFVVIPQNDMNKAVEQMVKDAPTRARMLDFMKNVRLRYARTSTRSLVVHAPEGTGHNFPFEAPDFVMGIVRKALAESGTTAP